MYSTGRPAGLELIVPDEEFQWDGARKYGFLKDGEVPLFVGVMLLDLSVESRVRTLATDVLPDRNLLELTLDGRTEYNAAGYLTTAPAPFKHDLLGSRTASTPQQRLTMAYEAAHAVLHFDSLQRWPDRPPAWPTAQELMVIENPPSNVFLLADYRRQKRK